MKCILATALAAILSMPATGLAQCTPMEMESPRSVTTVICDGEIPIIERRQKPEKAAPESTKNVPPHVLRWINQRPTQPAGDSK